MRAPRRYNSTEMHFFYCLNCGNLAYELPRRKSKQYKKGHLKKLYCPHCQKECNSYECRNEIEAYEFKEKYANGDYKEEAQMALEHCEKEKALWNRR